MERFLIKTNDALAAAVRAKAAEDLQEPAEWIIGVLAAHASGKCGSITATAGVTASGLPVAPRAAEAERGRGRPRGGSVEMEGWYKAVMEGDAATMQAALIECGCFPPGGVEVVEGDPKKPGLIGDLFNLPLKERIHEIRDSKTTKGGIEYVQTTRLHNRPNTGEHQDSTRVVTTSRKEIWGFAKEALGSR